MSLFGSGTKHKQSYYIGWGSVFALLVALTIGGLYWATMQVDYVWRWYLVPQYFYTVQDIEVRAEVEGEVESISTAEDGTTIVVSGDYTESYTLPPEGELLVNRGDFIYSGDTLGTYEEGQIGLLLKGMWLTLKVSVLAIIVGVFLGLVTGLCRLADNPVLRWSAVTYIELIRGSPLLVQIFIWYFVFGSLTNTLLTSQGLPQVPPLWFGVASLAFFTGAYVGEIVRAGIQSVHRGQMEAARSLGMNGYQAMRHIILPQALRRILPPLAGQFISLIKDSSLLGIIAIRELTKATREIVTVNLQPFEMWFVCAALYLILTFVLSLFSQYLERRMVG
jgi:polar amino acid transport system permease protein